MLSVLCGSFSLVRVKPLDWNRSFGRRRVSWNKGRFLFGIREGSFWLHQFQKYHLRINGLTDWVLETPASTRSFNMFVCPSLQILARLQVAGWFEYAPLERFVIELCVGSGRWLHTSHHTLISRTPNSIPMSWMLYHWYFWSFAYICLCLCRSYEESPWNTSLKIFLGLSLMRG